MTIFNPIPATCMQYLAVSFRYRVLVLSGKDPKGTNIEEILLKREKRFNPF
jgi:hypothetical protein